MIRRTKLILDWNCLWKQHYLVGTITWNPLNDPVSLSNPVSLLSISCTAPPPNSAYEYITVSDNYACITVSGNYACDIGILFHSSKLEFPTKSYIPNARPLPIDNIHLLKPWVKRKYRTRKRDLGRVFICDDRQVKNGSKWRQRLVYCNLLQRLVHVYKS